MDRTEKLLKEITEVPGISGYESEVRRVMRRYLEPVAKIEHDRMGSIIGVRRGTADGPRVMLAGHMDEVGFLVKLVTKEGFCKFVTVRAFVFCFWHFKTVVIFNDIIPVLVVVFFCWAVNGINKILTERFHINPTHFSFFLTHWTDYFVKAG